MKMIQTLIISIITVFVLRSGAQSCFDIVNVKQKGDDAASTDRQVIVPRSSFSCNGRVTGYLISLESASSSGGYPSVQIWHPTSSTQYTRVDTECPLTASDISMMRDGNGDDYYLGNVSCTGNNRIEFQSGDVIGYHHASEVLYRLWNIDASGYTAYHRDVSSPLNTFNIDSNTDEDGDKQPLIQVMYDIRCDDLSTPANGEITSCSSGRVGVGYEGDTCSFTCNTGYELTGSDTRTCQSDRNWSGIEMICADVTARSASATTLTPDMITSDSTASTISSSMTTTNTMTPGPTASTSSVEASDIMITSDSTASTTSMAMTNTMTSDHTVSTSSMQASNVATSYPITDTSFMTSTSSIESIEFTTASANSTVGTNFLTSSGSDVMATTPPNGARQEQNDDGGSDVGGIVAGCVVAFILIIVIVVCLIIFLLWYRAKKKEKYARKQGLQEQNRNTTHVAEQNRVQIPLQNKNMMYEIPNHSSSTDQLLDANVINTEPYLCPINTIEIFATDDYEAPPDLNSYYVQPDNVQCEGVDYLLPTANSVTSNTMQSSTLSAGQATLPEDERLYEDPGHIKEEICEWFKQRNVYMLDKNSVSCSDFLGSGEFGTVHFGLWSNGSADPVQVAVKTLNSQCSESDRVKFLREAAIMGQFVHNNVVQLHGVVTEEENMMIVLEYMPKGDLQNHLLKTRTLSIKSQGGDSELKHDLLSYCRQIAYGLNYLANKQFVHRDLAARNILVSNDDVCKIADFGMARDIADDNYYVTTGGKIPLKWTSPEAIFYKRYSAESDVWSFGCVMYEIWSLSHKPFENCSAQQYNEKIAKGYRLPPPPGCPRAIYELMIQCWHPDVRSRPHPGLVLRTLQKSDRNLLQWSMPDDDKSDGQVAMLGAPLSISEHLYHDLQSMYLTT